MSQFAVQHIALQHIAVRCGRNVTVAILPRHIFITWQKCHSDICVTVAISSLLPNKRVQFRAIAGVVERTGLSHSRERLIGASLHETR